MSLMSRALGSVARMSVVAAGTALVSSVIVGVDKQTGARRASERRRPGPYSAAEREAAVRSYLDAITHSAAAFEVPFAKDCVRVENGLRTGFGATQMHWDLHLHLQYAVIRGMREAVVTAGDDDIVRADFVLDLRPAGSIRVHEEFRVPADDGLIHRIDAHITAA